MSENFPSIAENIVTTMVTNSDKFICKGTESEPSDFVLIAKDQIPESRLSASKLAHAGVDLAYKIHDAKTYPEKELNLYATKLAGTGWQILCKSSDYGNTYQSGYKAVAFVNHSTKEVHIATAGTKPTDLYDLWDDIKIISGYTPTKLAPMKGLVDKIIELVSEGGEAVEYSFSTSGHSLGAIMSDLTLVELHSRDLKIDKSVTFDSPGSQEIVTYARKENLFTGKVITPINQLAAHCEIYNSKPNIVNTTNAHLAKNINLVLPNKAIESYLNNDESNLGKVEDIPAGVWGFGQYLYGKIGTAISNCSEYLGVKTVVDYFIDSHHSHSNFCNVIEGNDSNSVISVNSWKEGYRKKLVVKIPECNAIFTEELDEEFPSLACIRGENIIPISPEPFLLQAPGWEGDLQDQISDAMQDFTLENFQDKTSDDSQELVWEDLSQLCSAQKVLLEEDVSSLLGVWNDNSNLNVVC